MTKNMKKLLLASLLVFLWASYATALSAQTAHDFKYVATDPRTVESMLGLARVTSADVLYDLGSGDGRIVIAAAKRGAYAIGFEIDRELIDLSRQRIRQSGYSNRAKVIEGDMFKASIWPATVVMLFFGKTALAALKPKLQKELRPKTRIISNGLPIGDWKPLKVVDVGQLLCDRTCWLAPLYYYER
jgi:protein-L-isoaspartate O-methyltransferase